MATSLLLPALRGHMGDWVYYSCLMPLDEIASRVTYAKEVHRDEALSKMIQRSLEGERAEHIATYLTHTKERFFNSLVLATYDGHPEWLEVGQFKAPAERLAEELSEQGRDTMGFISLSGTEKIFAVDGQHRLAGIKRAVGNRVSFNGERVPVVFIAHVETQRQRTRRLFTTLNKTARPVKKLDIIALDEDDTMAITARRLVETNPWFRSRKIAIISSESLPASNDVSLTTIANLYDVLKQIFKHRTGKGADEALRFYRPSDKELDKYYEYATRYFQAIAETFPEVGELFKSNEPTSVTLLHRSADGGHVLFRPVGLHVFTSVAIDFARYHDIRLDKAVRALRNMPTDLNNRPYKGVIWDPLRRKMILTGRRLLRDLLKHMAGLNVDANKIRDAYARALGSDTPVRLPGLIDIDLD